MTVVVRLNPYGCSVAGCVKPARSRGAEPLCRMHQARIQRHGSVDANFRRTAVMNYEVVDSGCWEWRGTIIGLYGVVKIEGKRRGAHRWVYERMVGPIPIGLHIDHLCRNTICVNPEHLEPVTCWENVVGRGFGPAAINSRKTHCIHGHELAGGNVYTAAQGQRKCRACARERWRKAKAGRS